MNAEQTTLDLRPSPENCEHLYGFITMAYVPCGFFCSKCETLISQFIPRSPLELGYVSADWAWHYRDGNPWTSSLS